MATYQELRQRAQERLAARQQQQTPKTNTGYIEQLDPSVVGRDPDKLLRNASFLSDLRRYAEDYGVDPSSSDQELIDWFYEFRNSRELNTVSIARDAYAASTGSPEERERQRRMKQAFDMLPSFWQEGGRGLGAVGDIGEALATDPANLIGFGAGGLLTRGGVKAGAEAGKYASREALKRGASREALKATGKVAAGEAALGAGVEAGASTLEQSRDIDLGLQDEFSYGQLGAQSAAGGVLSGVAGGAFGFGGAAIESRGINRAAEQGADALADRLGRGAGGANPTLRTNLKGALGEVVETEAEAVAEQAATTGSREATGEQGEAFSPTQTYSRQNQGRKNLEDALSLLQSQVNARVRDGLDVADEEEFRRLAQKKALAESMLRWPEVKATLAQKQAQAEEKGNLAEARKIGAQIAAEDARYARATESPDQFLERQADLETETTEQQGDLFGERATGEGQQEAEPEAPARAEETSQEGEGGEEAASLEEPAPEPSPTAQRRPAPEPRNLTEAVSYLEERGVSKQDARRALKDATAGMPNNSRQRREALSEATARIERQQDTYRALDEIMSAADMTGLTFDEGPEYVDFVSKMAEAGVRTGRYNVDSEEIIQEFMEQFAEQGDLNPDGDLIARLERYYEGDEALENKGDQRKTARQQMLSEAAKKAQERRKSIEADAKADPETGGRVFEMKGKIPPPDSLARRGRTRKIGDDRTLDGGREGQRGPDAGGKSLKRGAKEQEEARRNIARANERIIRRDKSPTDKDLYDKTAAGDTQTTAFQAPFGGQSRNTVDGVRTSSGEQVWYHPELGEKPFSTRENLEDYLRAYRSFKEYEQEIRREAAESIGPNFVPLRKVIAGFGQGKAMGEADMPGHLILDAPSGGGSQRKVADQVETSDLVLVVGRTGQFDTQKGGRVTGNPAQMRQDTREWKDPTQTIMKKARDSGTPIVKLDDISDLRAYLRDNDVENMVVVGQNRKFAQQLAEVTGDTSSEDIRTFRRAISNADESIATEWSRAKSELDATFAKRRTAKKEDQGSGDFATTFARTYQESGGDDTALDEAITKLTQAYSPVVQPTPTRARRQTQTQEQPQAPAAPEPGRRLAIKSKSDPKDVRVLSRKQAERGEGIERLLGSSSMDDYMVGTVDEKANSGTIAARDSFRADGDVSPEAPEAPAETTANVEVPNPIPRWDQIAENKVTHPITGKETTIREVWSEAYRIETAKWPLDSGDLPRVAEKLRQLYSVIPTYRARGQSQIGAVKQLHGIFEKHDPDMIVQGQRLLRRLADNESGSPVFQEGTRSEARFMPDPARNDITLDPGRAKITGSPISNVEDLYHEVAHWAYFNILSSEDRANFWGKLQKYYDENGDLQKSRVYDKLAKDALGTKFRGDKKGYDYSPQEFFANQFVQWSNASGQIPAADTFMRRVAKVVESLIERFFSRNSIDPDLEEYFDKILPLDPSSSRLNLPKDATTDAGALSSRNAWRLEMDRLELETKANRLDTAELEKQLAETTLPDLRMIATNEQLPRWVRVRSAFVRRQLIEYLKENRVGYGTGDAARTEQQSETAELSELDELIRQQQADEAADDFMPDNDEVNEFEEAGFSVFDVVEMQSGASEDGRELALSRLAEESLMRIYEAQREFVKQYGRAEGVNMRGKAPRPAKTGSGIGQKNRARKRVERGKQAKKVKEKQAQDKASQVSATPKPKRNDSNPAREAKGKRNDKKARNTAQAPEKLSMEQLVREINTNGPASDRGQQVALEIERRVKSRSTPAPKVDVPQDIKDMDTPSLREAMSQAIYDASRDRISQIKFEMQERARDEDASAIAKLLENREVRLALDREVSDNRGISEQDAIPLNARGDVREMLGKMTHRDPETQVGLRRTAYRLLNLHGRAQPGTPEAPNYTTYGDMARLLGNDTPSNAGMVASDLSDDTFKSFRSKLRRLSAALIKGDDAPSDVMRDAATLAARTNLLTEHERNRLTEIWDSAGSPDGSPEAWLARNAVENLAERASRADLFEEVAESDDLNALDALVGKVQDGTSYLVNGLIGRDSIKNEFRSVTYYGDMFANSGRPHKVHALFGEGSMPSHLANMMRTVPETDPDRLARIKQAVKGTIGADRKGNPITWYHGTPAIRALRRRGEKFRFSTSGNHGGGAYFTLDPDVADQVYHRRMTNNAVRNLASQTSDPKTSRALLDQLREIRDHINIWRAEQAKAKSERNSGKVNRARAEVEQLLVDERNTVDVLMEEFGIEGGVQRVHIFPDNAFDFTEDARYANDDPLVVEIVGGMLDREIIDDDVEMEVFSTMQGREYDGEDFYMLLEESIARTLEERGMAASYEDATNDARNEINEFLQQELGYDGLIATESNSLDNGQNVAHTVAVMFDRTKFRAAEADFLDFDSEEFLANPQIRVTGSIGLEALESDTDLRSSDTSVFTAALENAGADKATSRLMRKMARREDPNDEDIEQLRKFSAPLQLRTNARRLRKVGMNWLADWMQPINGTGHFTREASETGRKVMPILQQLQALPGSDGGLMRWARKNKFWGKTAQPEPYKRIVRALRTGDPKTLNNDQEVQAYNAIRKGFRDELEAMKAEGIPVGDVGQNYFPQVYDIEAIKRNRDAFEAGIMRYLEKEHRLSGEPLSRSELISKAQAFSSRLIDEEGVFTPPYKDKRIPQSDNVDYHRMLRLERPEFRENMEELESFLSDDLVGITAKYFDGTTRRRLFHNKFGVNNHAFHDYLAVVEDPERNLAKLLSTDRTVTIEYRRPRGKRTKEDAETVVDFRAPFGNEHQVEQSGLLEELMQLAERPNARNAIRERLLSLKPDRDAMRGDGWAKRADAIASALADTKGRRRTVDASELEYADDLFRLAQRKPVSAGAGSDKMRRVSQGLRNINAVTLLGFTTLTSLTDVVLPTVRSGSMRATFRGWSKLMSDPEYRQMIRNSGTVVENVIHQRLTHIYGGGSGRAIQSFFNFTGLAPWTDLQREVSSAIALESFKAEAARMQRLDPKSRQYRMAMRYLREFGLDEYGKPGAPVIDEQAVRNDPRLRDGMIKFANETIFAPDADQIPKWAHHPVAAIAFQLKSFPLMAGRLSRKVLSEFRQGNPWPLTYAMTLGTGMGMSAQAVKDVAQARGGDDEQSHDLRERKLTNVAQEFGYEPQMHGDLDEFLGWYLEGFLHLGGLGLIADMMYQTAQQTDNGAWGFQRTMGTLFGPTFGLAADTFNVAAGVQNKFNPTTSNAKERAGVRAVASRTPVLGQMRTYREGITDALAGEDQDQGGGGFGGFGGGFGTF